MFNFARQIVRHKIGVVALIAFGVVVFSGDGNNETRASNPWSSQPAQAAAPAEESFVGSAIAGAKSAANDLIRDQVGVNPEETLDSWDKTADAYQKADAGR